MTTDSATARGGRPVHPATLSRWITKGVPLQSGGRLKLSARRFPGSWAVTREALNEFIGNLTTDRLDAADSEQAAVPRMPAARQRAHDRAERELAAAGI